MASSSLGEFLRACRGQVTPAAAGVPTYGVRRVPGLRREEVATMAGVSVDYYARLEQGREQGPSAQVLEALSQVLQLDVDSRLHLYQLAGLVPGTEPVVGPERVDSELRRLMNLWPETPALILGRAYDVLAGNELAYALFDGFRQGPSLIKKVFLDPDARAFYPDWDSVARNTVAGFRVLQGRFPHDPRFVEVIAELTRRAPEFVEMWERQEARGKRSEIKRFHHSEVGEITLRLNVFDVRSAPGQELIVYHAEQGSRSADALALLGTLTATWARERQVEG